MLRPATERILLIGDIDRQVQAALAQVMPLALVTPVANWFDAIAELSGNTYSAIIAAAEPIERRPEAAVNTLRTLAGEARIVLFGHPTLEPLSRKMLGFGCDDYLITPASPGELNQIFGSSPMRIASAPAATMEEHREEHPALAGLSLAELLTAAIAEHPHDAAAEAVRRLNLQFGPGMQFFYAADGKKTPPAGEGQVVLSHPVREGNDEFGQLHLLLARNEDVGSASHLVAKLAPLIARLQNLQDRHNRLQRLAITDDLTGLYNGRYFKHFLTRIVERARVKRFPVALFLFDIDNFKKYNDKFGHGVGDEILRATASLMRRCCREHDLVARIGGDEFAVVFWEKEGPRQPKEPKQPGTGRVPQTPLAVLGRFQKALSTHEFKQIGPSGKGVLTISGSLAIYPYDARGADELIEVADHELMFRAKRSGKNSIYLVGSGEQLLPPAESRD